MKLDSRKVKITGVAAVTPAGIGKQEFERGINESISRVGLINRFDPEAGTFVGAEIRGFDLRDYAPSIPPRRTARQTQFALAGVILALRDAGITIADLAGTDPVVVSGCSMMDPLLTTQAVELVSRKGPRFALASVLYQASPSAIGGTIANMLETRCHTMAIQTSCCSGLDAIGQGALIVASGQADIVICCGTEAPLSYHPMLELGTAELSPSNPENPSSLGRPFDLWRSCGVLGEGAGAVILESENSPREAYAWIEGYAFSNDVQDELGTGLEWSMIKALDRAQTDPNDVDLIHAWGTGHVSVDLAEAKALRSVFGERLREIAAVSLKGAIGYSLAASGAIQVVSAALALRSGVVPPTVNWERPDPGCPLNLSRHSRQIDCSVALVNAHGLSGTNAAVVLRRR